MNAKGTGSKEWGALPVSILRRGGALDRPNYETLVQTARDEMEQGAAHIIVDMTETDAISLAGAIGLYMKVERGRDGSGLFWLGQNPSFWR